MKIFSALYEKMLQWGSHRFANRYLAAVSFVESSFFPIPPDVMLAPMVMAKPHRAWYLAGLTTVMSVLGGIAGYAIGYFLFDWIGAQFLDIYHLTDKFEILKDKLNQYGIWFVFLAGFSPLPYKLFTITAGVVSLSFPGFVLASLVSRAARFYLVAGLFKWFGWKFQDKIHKIIDIGGWVCVVLVAIAVAVYALF